MDISFEAIITTFKIYYEQIQMLGFHMQVLMGLVLLVS
jgi:hypothetical protein